ncbi:MAG: hypothetical protein H7141_04790 [Burkholderiales bacterium]|nr:hypothetical protein [Bacteroidia bacterium]
MKVTLNIKDSFYNTFMDFLKHLPEVNVEEEKKSVPQWQIDEVTKRMNSTPAEKYISLEDAKKTLKFKK